MSGVAWPGGKLFAFSIVDDTDGATLDNVPAVYALLAELGFRTTKSIWMLSANGRDGLACDDARYRAWAESLQEQGFEIALHNVASRTSPRERTIEGVERFREVFGAYPSVHVNHAACRENIYWGPYRVSGRHRVVYDALTLHRHAHAFAGHVEQSPLFWGDVCQARVKYVRNFVHGDVNTLRYCPEMPYHDRERPYVRYWFASTEGPNVNTFVERLAEPNVERLAAEGGACIMYTHFASGFAPHGELDPRFVRVMRRLSTLGGWFVPVTELLDHLVAVKGHHDVTDDERARLERRWLAHKLRVGGTS
jgi:predicted deacetylase